MMTERRNKVFPEMSAQRRVEPQSSSALARRRMTITKKWDSLEKELRTVPSSTSKATAPAVTSSNNGRMRPNRPPMETTKSSSLDDSSSTSSSVQTTPSPMAAYYGGNRALRRKLAAEKQKQKAEESKKKEKEKDSTSVLVESLQSSLDNLDRFLQRNLQDEIFLARKDMMPKHFEKSEKLRSRWKKLERDLVFEELLVTIKDAKRKKSSRSKEAFKRELYCLLKTGSNPLTPIGEEREEKGSGSTTSNSHRLSPEGASSQDAETDPVKTNSAKGKGSANGSNVKGKSKKTNSNTNNSVVDSTNKAEVEIHAVPADHQKDKLIKKSELQQDIQNAKVAVLLDKKDSESVKISYTNTQVTQNTSNVKQHRKKHPRSQANMEVLGSHTSASSDMLTFEETEPKDACPDDAKKESTKEVKSENNSEKEEESEEATDESGEDENEDISDSSQDEGEEDEDEDESEDDEDSGDEDEDEEDEDEEEEEDSDEEVESKATKHIEKQKEIEVDEDANDSEVNGSDDDSGGDDDDDDDDDDDSEEEEDEEDDEEEDDEVEAEEDDDAEDKEEETDNEESRILTSLEDTSPDEPSNEEEQAAQDAVSERDSVSQCNPGRDDSPRHPSDDETQGDPSENESQNSGSETKYDDEGNDERNVINTKSKSVHRKERSTHCDNNKTSKNQHRSELTTELDKDDAHYNEKDKNDFDSDEDDDNDSGNDSGRKTTNSNRIQTEADDEDEYVENDDNGSSHKSDTEGQSLNCETAKSRRNTSLDKDTLRRESTISSKHETPVQRNDRKGGKVSSKSSTVVSSHQNDLLQVTIQAVHSSKSSVAAKVASDNNLKADDTVSQTQTQGFEEREQIKPEKRHRDSQNTANTASQRPVRISENRETTISTKPNCVSEKPVKVETTHHESENKQPGNTERARRVSNNKESEKAYSQKRDSNIKEPPKPEKTKRISVFDFGNVVTDAMSQKRRVSSVTEPNSGNIAKSTDATQRVPKRHADKEDEKKRSLSPDTIISDGGVYVYKPDKTKTKRPPSTPHSRHGKRNNASLLSHESTTQRNPAYDENPYIASANDIKRMLKSDNKRKRKDASTKKTKTHNSHPKMLQLCAEAQGSVSRAGSCKSMTSDASSVKYKSLIGSRGRSTLRLDTGLKSEASSEKSTRRRCRSKADKNKNTDPVSAEVPAPLATQKTPDVEPCKESKSKSKKNEKKSKKRVQKEENIDKHSEKKFKERRSASKIKNEVGDHLDTPDNCRRSSEDNEEQKRSKKHRERKSSKAAEVSPEDFPTDSGRRKSKKERQTNKESKQEDDESNEKQHKIRQKEESAQEQEADAAKAVKNVTKEKKRKPQSEEPRTVPNDCDIANQQLDNSGDSKRKQKKRLKCEDGKDRNDNSSKEPEADVTIKKKDKTKKKGKQVLEASEQDNSHDQFDLDSKDKKKKKKSKASGEPLGDSPELNIHLQEERSQFKERRSRRAKYERNISMPQECEQVSEHDTHQPNGHSRRRKHGQCSGRNDDHSPQGQESKPDVSKQRTSKPTKEMLQRTKDVEELYAPAKSEDKKSERLKIVKKSNTDEEHEDTKGKKKKKKHGSEKKVKT